MVKDWQLAENDLRMIHITENPNNQPVTISGSLGLLNCIGIGTDAAVFCHRDLPDFAFKLYANTKISKLPLEQEVYLRIGDSPYFPKLFSKGDRYLVLSYEKGITLYDCLLLGVNIPRQVITDVEEARSFIVKKGLNPRDIHLKNILLQNGRAKLLDLSEYLLPGNDLRWEHLKRGYEEYYHVIDGKTLSPWLLDTVKKLYEQKKTHPFFFEEFIRKVSGYLSL